MQKYHLSNSLVIALRFNSILFVTSVFVFNFYSNLAFGGKFVGTEPVKPLKKSNKWIKPKYIPRYSLENYLPPIGNQGDIGSCTGWATTYYGMTIVKRLESGINVPAFSPLSTYNRYSFQEKKSPNLGGAWIVPCLNLLLMKGCPTVDEYPFSYGALDDSRSKYEHRLFNFNPVQVQNVDQIKESILNHKPVVIGISIVYNRLGHHLMSGLLESNGLIILDNFLTSDIHGMHAMCIVGYDDEIGGGAFKLVNSWGESWGNKGFCWLRYRDLRIIQEAYALVPNPFPKTKIEERNKTRLVEIRNQSSKIFYLAYGLNTCDGLITKGWQMILPDESIEIPVAHRKNDHLYFLIMNERGEIINNPKKKNNKYLPISLNKAFEFYTNEHNEVDMSVYKFFYLKNERKKEIFNISNYGNISIIDQ